MSTESTKSKDAVSLSERLRLLSESICRDMECPAGIPCRFCPATVLMKISREEAYRTCEKKPKQNP